MEGEKLENEVSVTLVTMIGTNDNAYFQSFIVQGPGAGAGKLDQDKFTRESFEFATMEWIDPRNLDAEKMEANINAAKAQIPEGYSFESVANYIVKIDNKGNLTESFKMLITEDGNKVKQSAGQSIIEYYELDFTVQEDGTVYCKDLE